MSFTSHFKEEEEEQFTPFFQAEEANHSFFDRENSQSESAFALFNLKDQRSTTELNLRTSLIKELEDICDDKMGEESKEPIQEVSKTIFDRLESKKGGLLSRQSGREEFKQSLASSRVQEIKQNSKKKGLFDFSGIRQLRNSRLIQEGTSEFENSKNSSTESKQSCLSFSFKGRQENMMKVTVQKEKKTEKIEADIKKLSEKNETTKETIVKTSSLNGPQRQELKLNMSLKSSRVRQERTASKIIPKQELPSLDTNKKESDPQLQMNCSEPSARQSKGEPVNPEPRLSLKEELARRKTLPLGKLKSIASKALESKNCFLPRDRPERKEEPMEIEERNNMKELSDSLLPFKISKKQPIVQEQSSKELNYLAKYESQILEINAEMDALKSKDNALHNSYQDIHIFLAQMNSELKKKIRRH